MTSKVTIYHVPQKYIVNPINKQACCINIIDTPGFGDTRGVQWDNKISSMVALLLKMVQELDYILLTVKSDVQRLSKANQFIFARIQGLYADDLSERVVGMFTFNDATTPAAYEAVKLAGIPIKERHQFVFNNSAIWTKSGDEMTNQFWDLGMKNFADFTEFTKAEDKVPVSLTLTSEVLSKRKIVEDEGLKAKRATQALIAQQGMIANYIQDAKANADLINSNKNFTKQEIYWTYEKRYQKTGNVTQCKNCLGEKGICHRKCRWGDGDDKKNCSAMDKKGKCTVCPNKCDWSDHINSNIYYEYVRKKRDLVLHDIEA